MQGDLASSQVRWDMGLIMGYIEIIKADGSGFTSKAGGELEAATFMYCDKCDSLVDTQGGKYIESDGIKLMWWCATCR